MTPPGQAEREGEAVKIAKARSLDWLSHRAAHIETCGPCRNEAKLCQDYGFGPEHLEHCYIVQGRDDAATLATALAQAEARARRLEEALELPLMFHSSGMWTQKKVDRWREITGSVEATPSVMCGHIRAALASGDAEIPPSVGDGA